MLFFWQFPHFLGIAWMYREDYERAGYLMLPPSDVDGRFTGREIFLFTLALLPVSLVPVALGQAGMIYLLGASLLGLAFLACGARLAHSRSNALARRLVLASVVYLPLVFALMMIDKTPA